MESPVNQTEKASTAKHFELGTIGPQMCHLLSFSESVSKYLLNPQVPERGVELKARNFP